MALVKERRSVEQEVILDVLCDNCGKSCKVHCGNFEYATIQADWGYESCADGNRYFAHICQDCFRSLNVKVPLIS